LRFTVKTLWFWFCWICWYRCICWNRWSGSPDCWSCRCCWPDPRFGCWKYWWGCWLGWLGSRFRCWRCVCCIPGSVMFWWCTCIPL